MENSTKARLENLPIVGKAYETPLGKGFVSGVEIDHNGQTFWWIELIDTDSYMSVDALGNWELNGKELESV